MITLEKIKEYFGDACKVFPKADIGIDNKLSLKTKKILYEIGLPNYEGYGGNYVMLDQLKLIDGQYLQFGTRKFNPESYQRCIDLNTGKIVNISYYPDDTHSIFVLNSDLESYLLYIYIYIYIYIC